MISFKPSLNKKTQLEEDKKRFKWQARVAKKQFGAVAGPAREFAEYCKDLRSDSPAAVNIDYLARVDAAKQTVLNHADFRGMIDQLPVDITGVQMNLSGVQARYIEIRCVSERAAIVPAALLLVEIVKSTLPGTVPQR